MSERSAPGRSHRAERSASGGFTLIEVLVAVAVIGILAAIAVPTYGRYLQESRRTDAAVLLSEAAGEQARFLSERGRYAQSMAELGYDSALTEKGFYTVAITRDSPRDFTLTATPVAGGPQASDADCPAIAITSTGAKLPAGGDCW